MSKAIVHNYCDDYIYASPLTRDLDSEERHACTCIQYVNQLIVWMVWSVMLYLKMKFLSQLASENYIAACTVSTVNSIQLW